MEKPKRRARAIPAEFKVGPMAMKGSVVCAIFGFWRNEGPDGIGVAMEFDPESDAGAEFLRTAFRDGVQAYHDNKMDPTEVEEQLRDLHGRVSDADKAMALLNIAYLDDLGLLPDDDTNGVLVVALRDRTMFNINTMPLIRDCGLMG